MSRRIRLTASAAEDIRNIAFWIARRSEAAGTKWVRDLDEKFERLADAPGAGTDLSDLRPGLRGSPFGNYLVFFKRARDGIQIVRVIHGARDYSQFLKRQ